MRRSIALCLATALTLGLTLLGAAPAGARSVGVADPSGDVMRSVLTLTVDEGCDFEADECEPEVDGDPFDPEFRRDTTRVGDLVATTFAHHRSSISITSQYLDIRRPRAGQELTWVALTRGANGQRRQVAVAATARRPGGVASIERMSDERAICRGNITRRIDYRANTVRVSFPRWCAGSPRRIKLSGASFRLAFRETDTSLRVEQSYDNPFRDGGRLSSDADLGWTPWLRRG
ncbi:hypothetical protein [Nocardioides aurantiacus]|uniref:Uncharacterized protein n=1 Tax=Nocardioides aurantiacus TaxID=86796 RepID=A0A3N2CRJ5_9ACTN|nr:hypothetical protein [Nocardioides aurantiacus]ROR90140.1 hypothetical protein EDD33_0975 [Nocardioides aurantiacus]